MLISIDELYTVVTWPESQDLMEHSQFDKCYLINDEKGMENFGSSAYMVPVKILMEISGQKQLIVTQ